MKPTSLSYSRGRRIVAESKGIRFALAALASFLFPLLSIGQLRAPVSVVRSGSFEIGGFVGASYGVDEYRLMGGGNITYAINKWILPYAEYSYFPGIGRRVQASVPGLNTIATGTYSVPFSDFHGGVHIRIPIREKPIVPYLVAGIGALHHFEKPGVLSYIGADGLPAPLVFTDPAGTDFAANFGGGLRYYISQRFGVRVEAKAYKPNSALTDVFGKVEAGFFFQLR